MLFNLEDQKNNKIRIKITLIVILVMLLSLMLLIGFRNNINLEFLVNLIDFGRINNILSIISIGIFVIYYYLNSKENLFIITLIHLSFFIDQIIFMFIVTIYGTDVIRKIQFLVLTYILRSLALIFIIVKKSKLKQFIVNKPVRSVVATIIISLILTILEFKYRLIHPIEKISNISIVIVNICIVYGFIVIAVAVFRIYKDNECVYMIIVLSTCMFLIARICALNNINLYNKNLLILTDMVKFIGYWMILMALFFEIINKVQENDILKNEFKIFYYLTESNPYNCVVVTDDKGNVIYANDLCKSMYCDGSKSLKEQYKDLNCIFNLNLCSGEMYNIKKIINKEGKYKGIIFTEDNKVIKIKVQKIDMNDKKTVFVTTFKFITEDYKANEKLRINESKLSSITENVKELIFVLDPDGKMDYINKNVMNILGYSKSDLIGKHYRTIFEFTNMETYTLGKKNEMIFIDNTILAKDNSFLSVESVLSEIKDDGKLKGYIITSRDVAYKKQVEHLQHKYNEIKEYEKIRNEFFANLSHEVRTPINIIYSCVQLLNSSKDRSDEEFINYYDKYQVTIKQNCFRMLRLVNNLIDITKIDAGFMKMNFCNYDIIRLVEKITLSVVPYVEEKNINIIFDTEVEELKIKCDPDKIERIMLNLIANAVKFTQEQGNILVYLELEKDWIIIKVRDDGIGIPKDLRKSIFERFIQVDKSLNRSKEGSGIGLALVKSLVELHDGQVGISDDLQQGSEFIIKLPITKLDIQDNKNECLLEDDHKSIAEKISVEFSDIYDIN